METFEKLVQFWFENHTNLTKSEFDTDWIDPYDPIWLKLLSVNIYAMEIFESIVMVAFVNYETAGLFGHYRTLINQLLSHLYGGVSTFSKFSIDVVHCRLKCLGGEWFLAGNQKNHQNFDPSLLTNKLWLVFMGMKQKKNSKWPTQKKVIFQNRQFSIFFCENFMERSLG